MRHHWLGDVTILRLEHRLKQLAYSPMKPFLLLLLIPMLTACVNPSLTAANVLAWFGDYEQISNQSYGPHALNRLDVYRPPGQLKGAVVFFYGGCWGACMNYTRGDYRFIAQALTSKGYAVVIPDYRHYPDASFPQMMEDSAAAVTWTMQHVSKRVTLMGHSAGGHLASMLTVNKEHLGAQQYANIQGFIGLAGAYDFIYDKPYLPKVFAGVLYEASQPTYFVDGTEPPMLLLYGDDDQAVYRRNIVNMAQTIKDKNGQVETHIYKGVDHTGILSAFSIPLRGRYEVLGDVLRFLTLNH